MRIRGFVRHGLLAGSMLVLLWLGWQALAGGFRQLRRSHTLGQKVETVTQLGFGSLSLMVALTCFWQRQRAGLIRRLWGISFATSAGLSSLVWGPPMPLIGVLFAGMALLAGRAINWALRTALLA